MWDDFARKVKEYEDASTESSTDPSTKEARKVSVQTVNIGKKKQMFWTSKVWVKVRENSVDSEHLRDVSLWCDTGKKGYIRNEQFDNRLRTGYNLLVSIRYRHQGVPHVVFQDYHNDDRRFCSYARQRTYQHREKEGGITFTRRRGERS